MFQERKRAAPASHVIMRRGNRGCVVPMHREISRGTLKGILEQSGVSAEEFIKAL
jgi:predicted RNA binding protein YcfA (HicA-like mRNA interferase family)